MIEVVQIWMKKEIYSLLRLEMKSKRVVHCTLVLFFLRIKFPIP